MSRTFAHLLPTPLDAESLAALKPLSRVDDLLLLLERGVERGWLRRWTRLSWRFWRTSIRRLIRWCCWQRP